MRRFTLAGAALALCLGLCTGPAAAQERLLSPKTVKLIGKLADAAQKDDCRTMLRLAPQLLKTAAAEAVPAEILSATHGSVAACEFDRGRPERAYASLLQATASDESADVFWHMRFAHEAETANHPAAVTTVEALSQGRGAVLNAIASASLAQLDLELEKQGERALRRRLLAVLASSGYVPGDVLGETDPLKARYARLLFDDGAQAEARNLILTLTDPREVAIASLDSRFRNLFGDGFDLRATTEKSLDWHRGLIGLYPDRLLPLVLASHDLIALGRPEEAIALLEKARRRIDDPAAFEDRSDHLAWWWNALGLAHAALGRYEEMASALGEGTALPEYGLPNVSQRLNLAYGQIDFGRSAEALATLEPFHDPALARSPYGEMALRSARGCALALEGRRAEAEEDIAFARAQRDDNRSAFASLLLCLDALDEVAAFYAERLGDSEQRAEALLELSDFDSPLAELPNSLRPRLGALKARTDVQAAIAEAGGIRRFNVQR